VDLRDLKMLAGSSGPSRIDNAEQGKLMKAEDAQRDREALDIFAGAVEMASAEASAVCLQGACGGDESPKARVEALLANRAKIYTRLGFP
jgi:hypothetical protein